MGMNVSEAIRNAEIADELTEFMDNYFVLTDIQCPNVSYVHRRTKHHALLGTAFNYLAYRVVLEEAGLPLKLFDRHEPLALEQGWDRLRFVSVPKRFTERSGPFFGDMRALAVRSFEYACLELAAHGGSREALECLLRDLPEISKDPWVSELVEMADVFRESLRHRERYEAEGGNPYPRGSLVHDLYEDEGGGRQRHQIYLKPMREGVQSRRGRDNVCFGGVIGPSQYGGDFDLSIRHEIVEFKTTERIKEEHALQALCYAILASITSFMNVDPQRSSGNLARSAPPLRTRQTSSPPSRPPIVERCSPRKTARPYSDGTRAAASDPAQ